ncbi:alpha/beta fold hydrolase [Clostridium sp.]
MSLNKIIIVKVGIIMNAIKIIAFIIGIIITVLIILILFSRGIDAILRCIEFKRIRGSYGQLVDVNGEKICVDIRGNGEKIVVLLPGLGTSSPVLDFKPLVERLWNKYTVVTVEPLGYGLSDHTRRARTIENITEELHTLLQKLGYSRYTFMGHSISGVYMLYYVNKYPDEVERIVGIDISVPKQKDNSDCKDGAGRRYMYRAMKAAGLVRVILSIKPQMFVTDVVGYNRSPEEKALMRLLILRNMIDKTVIDEDKHLTVNFQKSRKLVFPESTPVLLFLASESCKNMEQWQTMHEEVIIGSSMSRVVVLKGYHYLHYYCSQEISDTFGEWMEYNKPKTIFESH